ncbi:MAG TPA: hypothetical protein DIW81_27970 [Planctomycetaceae bacterium]|nr:hypothetical protein [Rubinisphaera sp.]HCS55377.1 hypothetical protein [Planctomycetaceae bacterium]
MIPEDDIESGVFYTEILYLKSWHFQQFVEISLSMKSSTEFLKPDSNCDSGKDASLFSSNCMDQ